MKLLLLLLLLLFSCNSDCSQYDKIIVYEFDSRIISPIIYTEKVLREDCKGEINKRNRFDYISNLISELELKYSTSQHQDDLRLVCDIYCNTGKRILLYDGFNIYIEGKEYRKSEILIEDLSKSVDKKEMEMLDTVTVIDSELIPLQ